MALEHRCDHYYNNDSSNRNENNDNDNDNDDGGMNMDVSSVLAQQAESSLSITDLETREVSKINPFAFAMPRQVHPGLYSSPTTTASTNSAIHSSSSTTTTTTTKTPASTPIKGVPGFPDFPWTGDFVLGTSASSGPSSMVSSPQNRSCSSNSSMTMMTSSFGHFVDEALTATPIRSNIATVVSHSPTKVIPSSFSGTTGDNNEYNAMLLDLHRDNTKNTHKHNLRRLKKLRRQRVNHGSLKAASIVQSMPKPQQTITTQPGEEFPSKNIHIDQQQQQQQDDDDQDMSGGFSTATASTTMTRRHQHQHLGRDDDTGCKIVVVKKKHPKNNSTKRASNKLWTKMQRRRTKLAVTKSFYVREWKRNGPFLQPEEPSAALTSDDKSSKPGDDPQKMAAMKKEKKRIKKKLKRDVVELSFDLNSLRV